MMFKLRMSLFIVVLLLLASAITTAGPSFDFRHVTWGISKEEVKTTEKAVLDQETADQLSYLVSIENWEGKLHYKFDHNILIKAEYIIEQQVQPELCMIDEKNLDETKYMVHFYRLRDTLIREYGEFIEQYTT